MTTTKTTAAASITATVAAGETPRPFSYEGYEANVSKATRIPLGRKGYGASETECCAYCGKLTLEPAFLAYLSADGRFVEPPAGEDALNDDLGFYPLGSDCARRLRKVVPVFNADQTRA